MRMARGAKPAKAKGKAGQPGSRRSRTSEAPGHRQLEQRLAATLEQQTATAEILHLIASSRADAQPVFDTIVRSAVRLCDGLFGSVFRFDGELLHLAAHHNYSPEALQALGDLLPMRPRPDSRLTAARAILTRTVIQVEDTLADRELVQPVIALAGGFRSLLAVPMLREGSPIGAIFVARGEPGPFAEAQIALLQTFADQAVIAVENVRLFRELRDKNRALTEAQAQASEALEQQRATAEILRVISASPTDLQPGFDTIVRNAARVCEAFDAVLALADGDEVVQRAHHGPLEAVLGARYPLQGTVTGRALLEARVGAGIHTESHGPVHFKTRSQAVAVYSVPPGQRP
jgi:GAF domain-containing protein